MPPRRRTSPVGSRLDTVLREHGITITALADQLPAHHYPYVWRTVAGRREMTRSEAITVSSALARLGVTVSWKSII